MQKKRTITGVVFLLGVVLTLANCGQKAEKSKAPPKAAPQVSKPAPKVEAAKPAETPGADLLKIKETALKEKEILLAKKDELQKLIEEKAAIPLTEQMGAEAKSLMEKIVELKKEIEEHSERYKGHVDQLKAGNVDTSELEM